MAGVERLLDILLKAFVFEYRCPNCSSVAPFSLNRVSNVEYSREAQREDGPYYDYFVLCPQCGHRIEFDDGFRKLVQKELKKDAVLPPPDVLEEAAEIVDKKFTFCRKCETSIPSGCYDVFGGYCFACQFKRCLSCEAFTGNYKDEMLARLREILIL